MGLNDFWLALLPSAISVIFDPQNRSGIIDRLHPRWRRFRAVVLGRLLKGIAALVGTSLIYWWFAWLYRALDISNFR
jgi:hypothetical protein